MDELHLTEEERRLLKAPPRSRLDTAARVARRRLEDPYFHHLFDPTENGEYRIIIVDPTDSLREVDGRVREGALPATICVPFGGTVFPIVVSSVPDGEDGGVQDCGPDVEFGMLVELIARSAGAGVTVRLTEPVQLAFAYD